MAKENCELAAEDIQRICDTFLAFEETPQSKIFPNEKGSNYSLSS